MDTRFDISANHKNGTTVARFAGHLDANQVSMLEQWFDQQLDGVDTALVLDLSGLAYISSSGLRLLLSMAKQMKHRQCRFIICGLFGMVREVFMVSGFMDTLDIFHTVDEALADV